MLESKFRSEADVSTGRLARYSHVAGDCLTVSIAAVQFYTLPLTFGTLPGGEIVAICALPVSLLIRSRRIWNAKHKTAFILMLLWLFAQFISNVVNDATTFQMIKGLAGVLFLITDFIVLSSLLAGSTRRFVMFGCGLLLGDILRIYFGTSDFVSAHGSIAENWKFGWAIVISGVSVLCACYFYIRRRFAATIIVVAMAGALNLLYDSRSAYLLTILSVILVLPTTSAKRSTSSAWIRARARQRFAIILILAIITGLLLGKVYSYVASNGLIGEAAEEKYRGQASDTRGFLFSGRPEILVELQAVADAPFLGHGSYPTDPKYIDMMLQQLEESHVDEDASRYASTGDTFIPAHSHLFVTWIWAGVLGALFWFYCLALSVQSLFELTYVTALFAPFFSWLVVVQIWDIVFSPFGLEERMKSAFILLLMLYIRDGMLDGAVYRERTRTTL